MSLPDFLPVIKFIWSVTTKCVSYHRALDENMNILKDKLEELNGRKSGIESETTPKLHLESILKPEVVIWLHRVQRFNDDKQLEEKFAKVQFFSRAYLAKHVAVKILEVEQHLQKGTFPDGLMNVAPPSRGKRLPTTALLDQTSSKKVEEIWNSLINDNVQKLGVYGMGGTGKSTIMQHIHNRVFERSDQFDSVHWITVSKDTTVKKLQGGIAMALKLNSFEEIKEEADRATMLSTRLREEKRCVLIFDDVWETFNLQAVGIPEPTKGNKCKMILTTRSLDVCRRMYSLYIKMELLSKDEAWNLFLDKAGRGILKTRDLKAVAKLVVNECACLPLAIITIGTSMHDVVDKHEWKDTLRRLKESTKGLGEMGKVIEQLKCSYTRLNDEKAQRCLLYCALYPEDWSIGKRELITLLIGEQIIDGTRSREEEFDEGHTILNKLEKACLLESCTSNMINCVKLHDLIRDMALQIMGDESMVETGVQLTEFPDEDKWKEVLERASLMGNSIEDFPADASPRCSRLKSLLLSKSLMKMIPDSFFVHMPSLCVLDLSKSCIEILPNSISDLQNLTTLILRGISNLYYVPSLGKLRRLRGLDLSWTKVEEVPEGMEMLENLQYLNFYNMYLKTFPTGILPKLIRLQLLILYCGSKTLHLKGEELTGLKKLETLVCQLYDLNDFNSYVKSLQRQHRRLPNYYNLHVGKLDFVDLFAEDECKMVKSVRVNSSERERKREEEEEEHPIVQLPNDVKEFGIEKCNEVSSLSDVQVESLFNLEVLWFTSLDNLRVLVDREDTGALSNPRPRPHDTFSRLRQLSISYCPNLKQLFTLRLVPYLLNLEEISVDGCGGLEELVTAGEEEEEEEENDNLSIVKNDHINDDHIIAITLPKLRFLNLTDLPELKSIICRRRIMRCDSIERIQIEGCPKLMRLPLYLPLDNGQPSPPPPLKEIKTDNKKWWDSLEWDNPIAKDVLQPLVVVSSTRYSFF